MSLLTIDVPALAKEIASELSAELKEKLGTIYIPRSHEDVFGVELFSKLRKRIHANGMTHDYFAEKLGLSVATLSRRMNNKSPWLSSEMYTALEILQLPHELLHEYFPKGGKG